MFKLLKIIGKWWLVILVLGAWAWFSNISESALFMHFPRGTDMITLRLSGTAMLAIILGLVLLLKFKRFIGRLFGSMGGIFARLAKKRAVGKLETWLIGQVRGQMPQASDWRMLQKHLPLSSSQTTLLESWLVQSDKLMFPLKLPAIGTPTRLGLDDQDTLKSWQAFCEGKMGLDTLYFEAQKIAPSFENHPTPLKWRLWLAFQMLGVPIKLPLSAFKGKEAVQAFLGLSMIEQQSALAFWMQQTEAHITHEKPSPADQVKAFKKALKLLPHAWMIQDWVRVLSSQWLEHIQMGAGVEYAVTKLDSQHSHGLLLYVMGLAEPAIQAKLQARYEARNDGTRFEMAQWMVHQSKQKRYPQLTEDIESSI